MKTSILKYALRLLVRGRKAGCSSLGGNQANSAFQRNSGASHRKKPARMALSLELVLPVVTQKHNRTGSPQQQTPPMTAASTYFYFLCVLTQVRRLKTSAIPALRLGSIGCGLLHGLLRTAYSPVVPTGKVKVTDTSGCVRNKLS